LAQKPVQPEQIIHFLVFDLAGQPYGVNVAQVEGVVAGPGREGKWTYQGQEIILHSLPRLLELALPEEALNRVLLIRRDGELHGFLVPTPRDIVALAVEDIFPLPPLIRRVLGERTLLWGVGRMENGLLLLVDPEADEAALRK